MSVLQSPKEYKRQRELYLDDKFHQRYPKGMFTLQRRYGLYIGKEYKRGVLATVAMYWHSHRRHGCRGKFLTEFNCTKGLYPKAKIVAVIYKMAGNPGTATLSCPPYQNNAFGKCTYYKTLEKASAASKRFDFPVEVLTVFKERHAEETT